MSKSRHQITLSRAEAVADRALACSVASAVSSLEEIRLVIETTPTWGPRLPFERFYREFLDALGAGTFDIRGKTRVALLNPQDRIALEGRRPQLRLTANRAQRLLEASVPKTSPMHLPPWYFGQRHGRHIFIEIDLAYRWMAPWLDPMLFDGWRRTPSVAEALCTAIEARRRRQTTPSQPSQEAARPMAITAEPIPTGTRSGVWTTRQQRAERQWEQHFVEMIRGGEEPDKATVHATARASFGDLSGRAFDRVWHRHATPNMKKSGPKGPRKPGVI